MCEAAVFGESRHLRMPWFREEHAMCENAAFKHSIIWCSMWCNPAVVQVRAENATAQDEHGMCEDAVFMKSTLTATLRFKTTIP